MIEPLKDVDYNKPFKTNELLDRGQDEASNTVNKINELVNAVNSLYVLLSQK